MQDLQVLQDDKDEQITKIPMTKRNNTGEIGMLRPHL
jgi:hypothetical protein